jgi:hypothetical protein
MSCLCLKMLCPSNILWCCRLIATRGFLRLICQHLQDSPLPQPVMDPSAASCSQASLSQRASLSSSKGVSLLQVCAIDFEVCDLLKK